MNNCAGANTIGGTARWPTPTCRKGRAVYASMPERDYSHRSLLDKLGVAPGQRVAVVNVRNEAFIQSLTHVTGNKPSSSMRGTYDRIFLQVDGERDLERIAGARAHLQPD